MALRSFFVAALSGLVAGCTELPPIDADRQARLDGASYPEFVQIDQIPQARPVDRQRIETDISSRVGRVNARAARVRGSILTSAERARLLSRRGLVRGQILTNAERARLGTAIQTPSL